MTRFEWPEQVVESNSIIPLTTPWPGLQRGNVITRGKEKISQLEAAILVAWFMPYWMISCPCYKMKQNGGRHQSGDLETEHIGTFLCRITLYIGQVFVQRRINAG